MASAHNAAAARRRAEAEAEAAHNAAAPNQSRNRSRSRGNVSADLWRANGLFVRSNGLRRFMEQQILLAELERRLQDELSTHAQIMEETAQIMELSDRLLHHRAERDVEEINGKCRLVW